MVFTSRDQSNEYPSDLSWDLNLFIFCSVTILGCILFFTAYSRSEVRRRPNPWHTARYILKPAFAGNYVHSRVRSGMSYVQALSRGIGISTSGKYFGRDLSSLYGINLPFPDFLPLSFNFLWVIFAQIVLNQHLFTFLSRLLSAKFQRGSRQTKSSQGHISPKFLLEYVNHHIPISTSTQFAVL